MTKRILALLGVTLLVGAASAAPEPATLLRPGADGTATVEGRVLENIMGCTVDVSCYLRLDLAGEELHIVYDLGEYPPCLNRRVGEVGIRIKPGTRVRAVGRYQHRRGLHVLDLCAAPRTSLEPLPPA